jgi:hypothetical protein
MVLIDAAVHSEHEQVIRCDFKPELIKRSVDPVQGNTFSTISDSTGIYQRLSQESNFFKWLLLTLNLETFELVIFD